MTEHGEGRVTVDDGRLHVDGWETGTEDVVRYFEEHTSRGQDAAALLESALKVGVLALRSADAAASVDYVQKEMERASAKISEMFEARTKAVNEALEQVFAEDSGKLARALQQYLGEGGHLADLFDPDRMDSALGRFRKILGEHFDGEGSKLHRMLDPTNSDSPLRRWKEQWDKQLGDLHKTLADYRAEIREKLGIKEGTAEAMEKSALKGRTYEEQVFDAVDRIARVFGDVVEPTGDTAAVGGGKVGDVLVTVNTKETGGASLRVIFEAKDKTVGLTPILRELDEGMQNRNASAAVAVYARAEQMPRGAAPFREQGKARCLCLYDKEDNEPMALEFAYRVARFSALATLRVAGDEVDTGGIREDLAIGQAQLRAFANVKRQLTQLKTSVDDGVDGLQETVDDLREKLAEVFERIDCRLGTDEEPEKTQAAAGSL